MMDANRQIVGVVPADLIGKARAFRVLRVSLGTFSLVEKLRYLPAPTLWMLKFMA